MLSYDIMMCLSSLPQQIFEGRGCMDSDKEWKETFFEGRGENMKKGMKKEKYQHLPKYFF